MDKEKLEELKLIGIELWELFNSVTLVDTNKLKAKIQELNASLQDIRL